MKRRFLCRVTSFALAAILAAESSMTAAAAQNATTQEAVVVENGETEVESENEEVAETISETVAESEVETSSEVIEETETESISETESEFETESTSEAEKESEAETEGTEEIPDGVSNETEQETEIQLETETEVYTEIQLETEAEVGIKTDDSVNEEESLEAPVIENLTVSDEGKVSFEWALITNAEGYRVYKSENQGEAWQLMESGVSVDETKASFTDDLAEIGKVYYYKVCAYQTVEAQTVEGEFSEIVNNEIELQGIGWGEEDFAAFALNRGETKQLSLTYEPVNATRPDIEWTTGNTSIAKVDENGMVTAVGKGSTTITAKAGTKTVTATVSVTVTAEQVILNKYEMSLRIGTAGILDAFVEPSDADEKVVWTSSDPEIASVDNGIIRAHKAGAVVITATAGGVSAECNVTVTVPVNKIELEKDSLEIEKGGNSKEVVVTILPLEATNRMITAEPEDKELVNCSVEDGKIILTSKEKLGKTNVKITVDELSTKLAVNVVEEENIKDDESVVVPVRKISFNLSDEDRTIGHKDEIKPGETYQLTAEILPANATNQTITWTSSDEKVAVVSESGLITATGKGMAQITAKAENGVYDKVTIIVSNDIDEVKINGDDITLYCNGDKGIFSEKLDNTCDIIMTDSSLTCTYRSSDESVATVDEKGHVTAVAPGTAQIIAVHQESGKSDAITVTVKRLIEELKLPVPATTVAVGTKMKLSAEIAPEEVTDEIIRWEVKDASPKGCLIYDGEQKVFIAENEGTAKIVATAYDDGRGKVQTEMAVAISSVSATAKASLSYNGKTSVAAKSGNQIALVTKIYDKDGNEKSLNDVAVVYKSSDEEVAVVDEKGHVTALKGGKAKITVSVVDGSNVSGSCTVSVEQRPEEIVFTRDEFVVAPKGTVTLKPTLLPANTKNKAVTWTIPVDEIVIPEGYEFTDGEKKNLVKIDAKGKVTVAKNAPEGLTATVRCTSKAFAKEETPVSQEVTVRVGKTKVTSLKLKKTSLELIGLGTQAQIEFTTKGADETTEYTWTSSDEEIVTVDENGLVTVIGYGTAKVTLCADNAKEVSCTVAAYPVKKGQAVAAASGNYGIQQAKNDGNAFVQLYFINKSTKSKLDAELFTFTSSNPELVYVDEKGIAYANPKTKVTKDTAVTITAALKDDPLKRKATTKVTVWTEQQVKNIEFQYSAENGKTKWVDITNLVEEEFKEGSTFKLKALANNADNVVMAGKKLSFSISDTSMAEIIDTNEASNIITVKVKKAGKFKITCMANDKMHVSRQVAFGMYSGTPILETASLGTVNKAGEIVEVDGEENKKGVLSDTIFTLTGVNGSEITDVTIDSVRMKGADGNGSSADLGFTRKNLRILKLEDSQYQLAMESPILAQSTTKAGTYEIVLSVKRTDMEIESSFSDDGAWEKITTSFKIADSKPGVKISNVTVNSFERGTWTKLKIDTKAEIENVTIVESEALEDYYEIMERQDGWYIAIKEEKFADCASKKIKGRLRVDLKGYEKPILVSVTVTAKVTKPSLKQLTVPDVLISQGDTAQITLYNNTKKENLTDYQVSLKSDKNVKWNILNEKASDKMEIKLVESVSSIKKAATYKQKVVVNKDGWRTPVELDVTVKASPEKVNPVVSFGKTTVTLNTIAKEEVTTLTAKTNKSNVTLKTGKWDFVNSEYEDMFTAEYQDGNLTIGLKPEAVEAGLVKKSSYSLQFVNVFDETADYTNVKTAKITLKINRKKPTVGVKVSGKMDLLNRKASTLTATVSVSGVNAEIADIHLINGTDVEFTNNFYSVREKNKITIYARNAAELKAGTAYKGKVEVTLKNGTVLEKDISFKLTQSVPKLKAIPKQTVYKAEADKVMNFDLNETLPDGIQIKEVVTRVLPAGFGVEYDKGHAYVVLNDDTIKPGQYTIQADVYFKGAQKVTGSESGKPVRVKMNVQVKEQ
ncbi:MAG: Ig-like domain-containing protein [Lachnospiraceae bacterium]|nr:Ig-like domain-containing protein [Lachnospiraceae bacterium]